MESLDKKLNDVFNGFVVRKDLVKLVKGNAAVPSYVLEYLLGQNCATDDESQIEAGVERVKDILAKHYVQRAEAGAIKSDIKQKGFQRVIDKVSVELNEKRDAYEASFENLQIKHVLVDSDTVKQNRRMLVSGVWCIADLSYMPNEAKDESSYILQSIKPIQLARFSLDDFIARRAEFTMDEWIDVLIQSIGLEPSQLGRRAKLFQLTRLVTYCERNYNLIELGPKGTGKSHVYSEFSPHGILISGGEITPAKLFVNNASGKIGLVGYWDCVAFDEFAGKNKRPKADIVDIMKNYMANKSFSRGIEQITAEASMVFVGNTSHDVSYMINQTDLFEDLPAVYHDPAFIDRLHAYIPGWEMDIIRGEMFTKGYGFIVDYFAEALRAMRGLDYSGIYRERFELSDTLSTRDRDGICKTYSGLMKIIFPGKDATAEEEAEIIEFALEMRARVKDQLYRIDETFARAEFSYRPHNGEWKQVFTLEELNYPNTYHSRDKIPYDGEVPESNVFDGGSEDLADSASSAPAATSEGASKKENTAASPKPVSAKRVLPEPKPGHREYREGQLNASYADLFGPYLLTARNVQVVDPYIRQRHQVRNLLEFIDTCIKVNQNPKPLELSIDLVTAVSDDPEEQEGFLRELKMNIAKFGVEFNWRIQSQTAMHDRYVLVDGDWKILLGRGLDVYQRLSPFALENLNPRTRPVKPFSVTYLQVRGE